MNNKGSQWRKWDLHVHTPASFEHQFKAPGKDVWEAYIEELEKVSGIAVIGITDYFSLEGYRNVLDYRKKGRLQNFNLILPNVEFRLDVLVENYGRLNYHVIFSDQVDVDEIEKEFLQKLNIRTESLEPRTLSHENIVKIGASLKKHEPKFKGSDYSVGCQNIMVSLKDIVDVLEAKKSIFYGNYLLVLEEEGWCLLDWGSQAHLVRKQILMQSHAIFSSNQNTRDWALGKKGIDIVPDFISEFSHPRPCIHGSDSHSFEKLCKPDEDRFCWIKAEPCFEGLKQIVHEPEDRVRIQAEDPEHRKSIYTLNSMRIYDSCISSELAIEEQNIELNRNLVAVTGGKGSGKTAMLDLVANCFEDRCFRGSEESADPNSFVQRIQSEKGDLKVDLEFTGEGLDKFTKTLVEEKLFRDSKITYLPQGRIEEYSGNRQKLDEKIEEIIFSNREVAAKGYKQRFDKLRHEIDLLGSAIDSINMRINQLDKETSPRALNEIEEQLAVKKGELKDREDKLKKLTESMDKDLIEETATLKKEETELQERLSRLQDAALKLETLKDRLQGFLDEINKDISDVNIELSGLDMDLIVPQVDFSGQLAAVTKILTLLPDRIEKTKKLHEASLGRLAQLSEVSKKLADLLRQIEDAKREIQLLQKQLDELNEKKLEINRLDAERKDKYQSRLNKYLEWKTHYGEVIQTFSRGRTDILSGIDFGSSVHFNEKAFIAVGLDLLDLRKINESEIQQYAKKLADIVTDSDVQVSAARVEEWMQQMLGLKHKLRRSIANYDFYKWVFDDYHQLSTRILFKETPMVKLSMGQKATVLLKLFLAEGDYPLIIDQPEESLDNRYVYDELVDAFREAKKKRQVIMATNNANLVVNTDAEQIIVAEFKDNRIAYRSGSLEDLGLRVDIVPILEGGEEAFKKREAKYGI
jgi:ABC-type lipoprotein export system ATPase subunit